MRKLAFPNAKKFDDLFAEYSFDKETAPASVTFDFDDCDSMTDPAITMTIGPFCCIRGNDVEYRSMWVAAKEEVIEHIKSSAVMIADDTMDFKIVIRDSGEALVCVDHNRIIGGLWLALIDPETIPVEDPAEIKGIEAVIALQKMAEITMTTAEARAAWRSFGKRERDVTMDVFRRVCGGKTN